MHKSIGVISAAAAIMTIIFFSAFQGLAFSATSGSLVAEVLVMQEDSGGNQLLQLAKAETQNKCQDIGRRADKVAKEAQQAAQRAAEAKAELDKAVKEMQLSGKSAEKAVQAALSETKAVDKLAEAVSVKAHGIALEAKDAGCPDSAEKAESAGKEAKTAANQLKSSIKSALEELEKMEKKEKELIPLRFQDPKTTEQERYWEEKETSPAQ